MRTAIIFFLMCAPAAAEESITYLVEFSKISQPEKDDIESKGRKGVSPQPILESKFLEWSVMDTKYGVFQLAPNNDGEKSQMGVYESLGKVTKINYTRIYTEHGETKVERIKYSDWPLDFFIKGLPDVGASKGG